MARRFTWSYLTPAEKASVAARERAEDRDDLRAADLDRPAHNTLVCPCATCARWREVTRG